MSKNLLELLCKKNNLSYILFNKEFLILETNSPFAKEGFDIRQLLIELIGMEDVIHSLKCDQKPLQIPMIYHNKQYYNLEIEPFLENDKEGFIAFIKETNEHSQEYAKALQTINKKTLIYDISDEKKQNSYYKEINRHLMTIHVDLDGIITMVNDASLYFFNLEKEKIKGKHFSTFFQAQKSKLNKESHIFIAQNSNNEDIFFHADIVPIKNATGNIVENIIVLQDITYLKRVKKELEYAQKHDALTGLANKHSFLEKVDKQIEKNKLFSICFINIDNLKTINTEYGAHAGDMLLKHITELLLELLDYDDTLMRLVADNFAVLFHPQKEQKYIKAMIKKIETLTQNNPLYYNSEDIIDFSYTTLLLSYPKDAKSAAEFLQLSEKKIKKKKIDLKK